MILILLDGPVAPMLSAVAAEFAEVTVILSPPLQAEDVDTSMVAGLKGSVKFLKSCKNSEKRISKQKKFKY